MIQVNNIMSAQSFLSESTIDSALEYTFPIEHCNITLIYIIKLQLNTKLLPISTHYSGYGTF